MNIRKYSQQLEDKWGDGRRIAAAEWTVCEWVRIVVEVIWNCCLISVFIVWFDMILSGIPIERPGILLAIASSFVFTLSGYLGDHAQIAAGRAASVVILVTAFVLSY